MRIQVVLHDHISLTVFEKAPPRALPQLHFAAEGTALLDVYHAADAFILPTIYDPCANAALEAAACGLPVITTEANGASAWTNICKRL